MDPSQVLIVIAGPTASGKSDLALSLAQTFKGEIVCSDSLQVYRKLDIGTSKPSEKEQKLVPHYQIDIIDPNENYSAGKYEKDTVQIISKIHARGCIPILVGGTGLYFRALMYGISKIPAIPELIKNNVSDLQLKHGTLYCWKKLYSKDPQRAINIHPNDTARILRSLEVYFASGFSINKFQKEHPFANARYTFIAIAFEWERNLLYERINQRTQKMLNAGWIEEVEKLLKDYPKDLKPFQSIGYREIIHHLSGKLEFNQMVQIIQQRTRRYAKRQLTWFKKEPNIKWFSPSKIPEVIEKIKVFLEKKFIFRRK